jgi:hypothetical protein
MSARVVRKLVTETELQPRRTCGPPLAKRLLKRIQNELRLLRSGGAPADDLVGKRIDDECHIDEPLPGRDVSKIRHPELVGHSCAELHVHSIHWTLQGLVRPSRFDLLAASNTFNTDVAH